MKNDPREKFRKAYQESGRPRALIPWNDPINTVVEIALGIYATKVYVERGEHPNFLAQGSSNDPCNFIGDFCPGWIERVKPFHNAYTSFEETIGLRALAHSLERAPELIRFLHPEHKLYTETIVSRIERQKPIEILEIMDIRQRLLRTKFMGLPGFYFDDDPDVTHRIRFGKSRNGEKKLGGRQSEGSYRKAMMYATRDQVSADILEKAFMDRMKVVPDVKMVNQSVLNFPKDSPALIEADRHLRDMRTFKDCYVVVNEYDENLDYKLTSMKTLCPDNLRDQLIREGNEDNWGRKKK